MQLNPETLLWFIPLPPVAAFFLIVLFTNRNKWLSHTVAVGGMAISWVLSLWVFWQAVHTENLGEHPFAISVDWMPTGATALRFGLLVDPLTAVTIFFVAWACLMIFIYSIGYSNYGKEQDPRDQPGKPPHHGVDPLYSRFFAFLSLFAFGMLTLVVSDNLLLLFMGWEIMGLCSYLLIGFWYARDYDDPKQTTPRQAAVKAFLTTRVADVFMLLGIAYLYTQTGTLNYREILHNADVLQRLAETASYIPALSVAGLVGILLFIGTIGKSAQFPLHVWLPDAMEGPTPVSAMIHAAAMVSAGVYMVIRFFPLISAGAGHGEPTAAMTMMAFIGAFTALFAATIAVAQNDVKRVLAYSTISQLGYMVAALGIGAYVAAVFHLVTHAFFKALLFLGSGSIIHGVEHGAHHTHEHLDPQDMFNMGGLRKRMPVTFWTFLIGGLALSGFPLVTAGFWSKDEILADAFAHGHWAVFVTLAAAALLTAFYTMRQISLTFLGEPRTATAEHASEKDPIFRTILFPLVVLSFFAVAAGWVGIPEHFPGLGGIVPNWFHEFVSGTLLEHPAAAEFNIVPLLTSLGVALGGLGLGWLVYRNVPAGAPDPLVRALGPIHTLLKNKYYLDELYHFAFIRPAVWISETFTYLWLDRGLIDGLLHLAARVSFWLGGAFRHWIDAPIINGFGDLVGEGTKKFGQTFRVIQTGRVQFYLVVSMAAAIVVSGVLAALAIIR